VGGAKGSWPLALGRSFLFDLAPGGVCLAKPVTRPAGELLPHRFTLTARTEAREAVYFLLHFPWPRGRWALPTTVSFGARTFLPPRPFEPMWRLTKSRPAAIRSTASPGSTIPWASRRGKGLSEPRLAAHRRLPPHFPARRTPLRKQTRGRYRPGPMGFERLEAFL
jgi:hypothetical protein